MRTIFELNRRYGLHKFLIIVPSVAIREGTLTQLRQTKQHFSELYATVAEVIEYSSKKLPQVRGFCVSNHLSIMVMNKQAFDSDKNIINDEERDGGNLLAMLQQVRPVIIMDEPQEGMDKDAILCLDGELQGETLEALKAYSDNQLIVLKAALDTTKKFELQTAFKDNLWVI